MSSDIFNQHASRSLNTSFVAHFAGMGRSRTKYEEIVAKLHSWTKNEEKDFFDTNIGSLISPSSKEDHQRKFYRKHHAIFDSFLFTKVLRRFQMAKVADFEVLDKCFS